MGFTLSKKKNDSKEKLSPNSIYEALMKGLKEMEKQGVDRVVLSLYESEPSKNATGKFLNTENFRYYPFEMLDKKEQKMIIDKKTYSIISLVGNNVGNMIQYPHAGVEQYLRTHVHPLLPKLKPESELDYVSEGGVYNGENLREIAKTAMNSGWTPELINQRIKDGIEEYHDITRILMEKTGVYNALQQIEQRQYSPFEQIMLEVRKKIVSAKNR